MDRDDARARSQKRQEAVGGVDHGGSPAPEQEREFYLLKQDLRTGPAVLDHLQLQRMTVRVGQPEERVGQAAGVPAPAPELRRESVPRVDHDQLGQSAAARS